MEPTGTHLRTRILAAALAAIAAAVWVGSARGQALGPLAPTQATRDQPSPPSAERPATARVGQDSPLFAGSNVGAPGRTAARRPGTGPIGSPARSSARDGGLDARRAAREGRHDPAASSAGPRTARVGGPSSRVRGGQEHPTPMQVRSATERHFHRQSDEDAQVRLRLPGEDSPRTLELMEVRDRVLLLEGRELARVFSATREDRLPAAAPPRLVAPQGPMYVARTQLRDLDSGETVILDSWYQQRTGLLEHLGDALRRVGADLRFRYDPHVREVRTLRAL